MSAYVGSVFVARNRSCAIKTQLHRTSTPSDLVASSRQSICAPSSISRHASVPRAGDVTVNEARGVGRVTVRFAVFATPLYVAVTVIVARVETVAVSTRNVIEVDPAGTVTVAGT